MRKKIAALFMAAMLAVGLSAAPVQAHSSYCGHGVKYLYNNNYEFYLTYDNVGGNHYHHYAHKRFSQTGQFFYTIHYSTRSC